MKKLIVLALILSFNVSASDFSYDEYKNLPDNEKCTFDNFPSREQVDVWIEGEIGSKVTPVRMATIQKKMYEHYVRYCLAQLNARNLELKFEVDHGYKP